MYIQSDKINPGCKNSSQVKRLFFAPCGLYKKVSVLL